MKESKQHVAWVIVCFIIATYFAWTIIYALYKNFSQPLNGVFVFSPMFLLRIMANSIHILLVSCFCFTRLGIRMLNTGRRYFETPDKRGAWRLLGSILITMVATMLLTTAINVYTVALLMRKPNDTSLEVGTLIISLVFIGISVLVFWAAFRVRKSALKKVDNEVELLGETI